METDDHSNEVLQNTELSTVSEHSNIQAQHDVVPGIEDVYVKEEYISNTESHNENGGFVQITESMFFLFKKKESH